MSDSFDKLIEELDQEVHDKLEQIGAEAEAIAREKGDYRNRTGRLRRSVYHKVTGTSLEFGDSAPYASKVSSKGYDVIDSGVSFIRGEIEKL